MKSILEFVNTPNKDIPKQLLNIMKDIEYDNKTNDENYIVKTPSQLIKIKSGICYDQVEFERVYFEKHKYQYKTYFAYEKEPVDDNPTHTFLIFKENNQYFWFENAWESYRGVHGLFKSYNDALKFVSIQFKKSDNWENVNILEYNKIKLGINVMQFYKHIFEIGKKIYIKEIFMKIFLGGTCNESTWREKLIPMLKIDYFNPVVEDWTPACMEEEIQQRQLCDLCLYVITPKMTGVYSIAEVIDDSNKRPLKTIFVRLLEDENLKFTDGQWRSLGAVADMVKRNGGAAFDNLEDVVEYINNEYNRRERSDNQYDSHYDYHHRGTLFYKL